MLLSCNEAIAKYNSTFEDYKGIIKPKNQMFNIEDSMLSLAASESVDGSCFYLVMRSKSDITCRFFESGPFKGFLMGCQNKIFDVEVDIPVQVYNDHDICQQNIGQEELFQNRRKKGKIFNMQ